jgi:hypothetical protein
MAPVDMPADDLATVALDALDTAAGDLAALAAEGPAVQSAAM